MATYISGGGIITGTSLGNLYVRLSADPVQLIRALTQTQTAVEGTTAAISRATLKLAATLSTTVGAVLGASIHQYMKFNQAMTESLAIMNEISEVMRAKMEATARSLARETGKSAAELAKSYYYLASAGLNAQQAMEALPVVAKFAAAGVIDLEQATSLLANAQSALGMKSKDAAENMRNMREIADVLVKANILADATTEQFAISLTRRAGPAMKAFNVDLYQGVAILAALADQGIKAEMAGEALAIALRDLQRVATLQPSLMRDMGIAVYDAAGNLRNFADIIRDFERALEGATTEQKRMVFTMLGFQDRSLGTMLALMGTSQKIREYERELRNASGTTEQVASKQLTSLQEVLNKAGAALRDLAIHIGERLDPFIRELASDVISLTEALKKFEEQTGSIEALVRTLIDLFKVLAIGVLTIWTAFRALGEVLKSYVEISMQGHQAIVRSVARITAVWARALRDVLDILKGMGPQLKAVGDILIGTITKNVPLVILGLRRLRESDLSGFRDVLDRLQEASKESLEITGQEAQQWWTKLRDVARSTLDTLSQDWKSFTELVEKLSPFTETGPPGLSRAMQEVEKSAEQVSRAMEKVEESAQQAQESVSRFSVQAIIDSQKVLKLLDILGTPTTTRRIQPVSARELLESMTFESGGGINAEKAMEMLRMAGIETGGGGRSYLGLQSPELAQMEVIQREIEENRAKLQILEELGQMEIQLTEEVQRKKAEAIEAYTKRLAELQQAQTQILIASWRQAFDDLTMAAEGFKESQKEIYLAMFAASKAFALAEAIIKIQQGIAAAAALPFPANLAAMASVASATASIISTIQGVILEFGGERERGGPVQPGKVYMVGERGPELFTPSQSGSIIPTERIGSNVRVVVNNYTNARAEIIERQEGQEKVIEVLVRRLKAELSSEVRDGRGEFSRSLESTYRLRR